MKRRTFRRWAMERIQLKQLTLMEILIMRQLQVAVKMFSSMMHQKIHKTTFPELRHGYLIKMEMKLMRWMYMSLPA